MDKNIFNQTVEVLTLWIVDESISEITCIEKMTQLGHDLDSTDLLMDIVNTPSVLNIGVKQLIINYLDQSYELDDDLDSFKTELADRLDITFEKKVPERTPYQEYLKNESGVYA